MKVTKLGYPSPILNSGIGYNAGSRLPAGGDALEVLTSDGSNGRYWGENVRRITSNGSNILLSPDVNIAAGSNITFAIASNTLFIHGAAGGGGGSSLTVEDEGSPLSTAATTLNFVGSGVTASGGGATKTITIPGGGGSILYPFDDITLDATYGDHFLSYPVDSKWTYRGIIAANLVIEDSWVRSTPYVGSDWGMLQPWTPTDEAEFRMKAAPSFGGIVEKGLGLAVLDSAGTGIWFGFRETSRLGIWTVTTYVIADEPANNNSFPGNLYLGEGRSGWWSLTKNDGIYSWNYSFNGETWSTHHSVADYVPTSFTPSQIGWLVGVNNTTKDVIVPIDWFNVTEYSLGNNLMITPSSGTVTASAATTSGGTPADVIDGALSDEWYVTSAANPIWWAATFSVAQSMNRLRIYSRADLWGAGYVEFSDGSTVPFYAPIVGWTCLSFPTKSTTLVKIHSLRQNLGPNPGFYEVEAYLAS